MSTTTALGKIVKNSKRVVVVNEQGQHQILGQLGPDEQEQLLAFVNLEGVSYNLHCVKPRMIIYRESMVSPPSGKLGEFHPEQR